MQASDVEDMTSCDVSKYTQREWRYDAESYVLCCQTVDNNKLALGLQSGECIMIDTRDCKMMYHLNENWNCEQPFFLSKSPITSLACMEKMPNGNKLIVMTNSSGIIKAFELLNGNNKSKLKFKVDDKRQSLCLDSCSDSKRVCTGGSGGYINIFDLELQKFISKIGPEGEMKARVFDVKFKPDTFGNIILSGGWDDVVNMWDMRDSRHPIKCIHGPHVCGDSIDFFQDSSYHRIIIGSWRKSRSISIWDTNCDKIVDTHINSRNSNLIYGLKILKGLNKTENRQMCVTVGCNPNMVKICDINDNFQLIESISTQNRTASCVCQNIGENVFFVGNGNFIDKFTFDF